MLINVDETSVRLVPEEGKGHASNRAYRLLCSGMPLGRNASLAAQMSAITHVTAICDHAEIQKRLPQVVLVSENQFTEGRAFRLRSEAPASVHLWRQKKAWMTTEVMVQYILLVGRLLQEFQTTHRFILYLDALRAHVSPRVLRAASRANLWICVIPAKMTWALQPCDTHVFASYKRLLGEEYQRRSGLTAAGDITWEILLESLWHVVTTLVQGRDWSASFDSVGIRSKQRALSDRTRRKLQYPLEPPQVQATLPALSDFEQIWPKGVRIPIHELFLPVEISARTGSRAIGRAGGATQSTACTGYASECMVRSHPQHECSTCILLHPCPSAGAMSSAATAGYAGTAAAAEDRGCSPELEDGQREERDAAPGAPQTAGETAAALAVEAAEHVEGGADDQNRDLGKDLLSEIS